MKTQKNEIALHWQQHSLIPETSLNFDWADAGSHCWNCGDEKGERLERCHIIPASLGGQDKPSNYVLLCSNCHKEAPNTTNPDDMWDWIKSNHLPLAPFGNYNIAKAFELFEKKEGIPFSDAMKNIPNVMDLVVQEFAKVNTHQSTINASTYYYLLKSVADKK